MKKVAIVTGGGRGIGKAIAKLLLLQNYSVVVADVKAPSTIKLDVRKEKEIKKLISKTVDQFGRIDCLINNAGILPELSDFKKTSSKTWDSYLETNLRAPFLLSKEAYPFLKKTKGSIVNIASTRAFQSEGNNEPYASSKGGLISLTHELAISFAPDIRVNCVSPGWIDTSHEKVTKKDQQVHPVGRVGRPEDIAYMVEFLISDKATFITGQNFIVDGGMTIKMIY